MSKGTVNKVILIGRLGADPEVRYMPNGTAVATLRMATNDGYKDKQSGQFVESTEWHRVVLFGRMAEIAGEYLKKGGIAYIEGRLRTNKWKDQNGQERYTTEIVGNELQLMGGGPRDGAASSSRESFDDTAAFESAPTKAPAAAPKVKPQAAPAETFNQNFEDDEIPF